MNSRQRALLRLLRRNPEGLKPMDIMTITGGTQHSVGYDLRALRDEGKAGPSHAGGSGVVWAATEDLVALKAQRAATLAALAAQAKERALRREQGAREREEDDDACDAFATQPVHRILAQADWLQCAPTRGVSSVFQLGGA